MAGRVSRKKVSHGVSHKVGTLFLRDLPRTLKDRFKAWCARRGKTMTGAVVEFMQECCSNDADAPEKRKAM